MKTKRFFAIALAMTLCLSALCYQGQAQELAKKDKNRAITPAATGSVAGSGTPGRISKWSGVSGSSTYVLGDSNIFEDKFGKIGIGTTTPTSLLTVQGMIEITMGGLKFPDGTVQTTSAVGSLFTVAHDATLSGNGTAGSPLGVAVPLLLTGSFTTVNGNGLITASNTDLTGIGVRGIGGTGILGNSVSLAATDAGIVGIGQGNNGQGGTGGIAAIFFGNVSIQTLSGLQPGNLAVAGTLSKGGGAFKIDHRLDPENKYLYHSFVESPDMKNIYDGNVVTDEDGNATVELPDYFEALNRDFRYQLTVIGTFAQAIIAAEIKENRFTIKTNEANVKVSWQVTGIRQDAFANKNRIPLVEAKPEVERGYYLHPEAFNQPEEKSINWARDPERMRQLKERRLEAEQGRKRQANQR